MAAKNNKLLLLITVWGIIAAMTAGVPALAQEGMAPFPSPDTEVRSFSSLDAADPPVLTLGSCYCSDRLWGTSHGGKIIKTIRPGEKIYGVFNATLSGAETTVNRTYKIDKYPGLLAKESEHEYLGESTYSWGFEIPDDKAAHGDVPKFSCLLKAEGGNILYKAMKFTVIRKGIVNSTRAYQKPMGAATKAKILADVPASGLMLVNSPLKFDTYNYEYSPTAASFITSLQRHRPNATLIHAHGSSENGGKIFLRDDSFVDQTKVYQSFAGDNDKYRFPSGLFYAAVCEGATYTTLGGAFINVGVKAFIGYQVSVYTQRNAEFYKRFFTQATKPNVSVAAALENTKNWALARDPQWTDVATA